MNNQIKIGCGAINLMKVDSHTSRNKVLDFMTKQGSKKTLVRNHVFSLYKKKNSVKS